MSEIQKQALKNWRLTEEEIIAYSTKDGEYCQLAVDVGSWGRDTQARKLVEWGTEICCEHKEYGLLLERFQCPECMRALKQELGREEAKHE